MSSLELRAKLVEHHLSRSIGSMLGGDWGTFVSIYVSRIWTKKSTWCNSTGSLTSKMECPRRSCLNSNKCVWENPIDNVLSVFVNLAKVSNSFSTLQVKWLSSSHASISTTQIVFPRGSNKVQSVPHAGMMCYSISRKKRTDQTLMIIMRI